MKMSFTAAVPCLGVAIVSNLHIHLVQARRQHREKTGDARRRPLYSYTLLPADEHDTVIVLASQVRTLDGENSMSYTKGDKKGNVKRSFPQRSLSHSSAKIISTCRLVNSSLFPKPPLIVLQKNRYGCSVDASVLFTIITWDDTLVSPAQILKV